MKPKKSRGRPAEIEEYADWGPKEVPSGGSDPRWIDKLTTAERRQFEAELQWAMRAYKEDLPGPRRVNVIMDFV